MANNENNELQNNVPETNKVSENQEDNTTEDKENIAAKDKNNNTTADKENIAAVDKKSKVSENNDNDNDVSEDKKTNSKFKRFHIQFNRIALLIFMLALISGGIYYYFMTEAEAENYETLQLYFSDKKFRKLILEERKMKKYQNLQEGQEEAKEIPLKEKLQYTLSQLINGSLRNDTAPLISNKTQIEYIYYKNKSLHISFSKDFIHGYNSRIEDDRIVVNSILATLFRTFKEKIDTVRLYVAGTPLKAITGKHDFNRFYKRDAFLKKVNPPLKDRKKLIHSLIFPDDDK